MIDDFVLNILLIEIDLEFMVFNDWSFLTCIFSSHVTIFIIKYYLNLLKENYRFVYFINKNNIFLFYKCINTY